MPSGSGRGWSRNISRIPSRRSSEQTGAVRTERARRITRPARQGLVAAGERDWSTPSARLSAIRDVPTRIISCMTFCNEMWCCKN